MPFALLRDEPGASKVAQTMANVRMSSVNYATVVSHFIHAGMPADKIHAMLTPLPLTIFEADWALATQVICPLLSGPFSILEMATKEEWNGKKAQAGGDHCQAA